MSEERKIHSLEIESIKQVENARITYGEEEMAELMVSMKARGLLSPIGVRKKNGQFEIVFGNRRLTAARKLGWKNIDAVLVETKSDEDMLLINAVENMQRADVPFAEQGRIFFGLKKAGLSEKEIAARIGIPERRVKRVMDTYRLIPAAFRPQVIKGTPGMRIRGGKVPASTIGVVNDLRTRIRLSEKQTTDLVTLSMKDGITGLHVRKLGGLIKSGVPIGQAMKKISNTRIVTVQIAVPADHIKRLEKQHKARIHDLIYGELSKMKWLGAVQAEK